MESDVIALLCLRLRGRCKGLAPTLFCFFCLLGVARPALAQAPQLPAPVPTRLTYTVASGCPDEHFFRTAVSGYLGRRDPFTAAGEQSLDVKVSRTGGTFKATIVFVDVHGERHPDKNKLDDPDCTQLVETAALVVMKWIDPVIPPLLAPVAVVPPKPVDPAPAPKPPSRAEIPPDDLPPVPPPPPMQPPAPITGRAELMLGFDTRPGTKLAPGGSIDIGFKVWKVSLAAQVHAVPVARPSAGGVNTTLLAGGLVACLLRFDGQIGAQPFVLVGCAIGEAGQIQGRVAGSYSLGEVQGIFAGGGGQIGVEIPLGKVVYATGAVNLLGVSDPGPIGVRVGGAAAGVGVGAGFSF